MTATASGFTGDAQTAVGGSRGQVWRGRRAVEEEFFSETLDRAGGENLISERNRREIHYCRATAVLRTTMSR